MTPIKVQLQLDSNKFLADIKNAVNAISGIEVGAKKAAFSIQKIEASSYKAAAGLNRAARAGGSFASAFRNIATITGVFSRSIASLASISSEAIGNIVRVNSEMERLNYQMLAMATSSGSIKEAAEDVAWLREEAKQALFSLKALTETFMEMKAAQLSPRGGMLKFFENGLSALGGTDDEQLNHVSNVITQIASKSVIHMKDLQQLGQHMPVVMQLMARSMGISVTELSKIIETGTLDARSSLQKLSEEMERTYDGETYRMMQSFAGQIIQFKNNLENLSTGTGGNKFFNVVKQELIDINSFLKSDEAKAYAEQFGQSLGNIALTLKNSVSFVWEYRDALMSVTKVVTEVYSIDKFSQMFGGGFIDSVKGFKKTIFDKLREGISGFQNAITKAEIDKGSKLTESKKLEIQKQEGKYFGVGDKSVIEQQFDNLKEKLNRAVQFAATTSDAFRQGAFNDKAISQIDKVKTSLDGVVQVLSNIRSVKSIIDIGRVLQNASIKKNNQSIGDHRLSDDKSTLVKRNRVQQNASIKKNNQSIGNHRLSNDKSTLVKRNNINTINSGMAEVTPNLKGGANLMSGNMRRWGDPKSKGWYQKNITTITTKSGKSAKVHKDAAPYFTGFLNELEDSGYKINDLGGYNLRYKRNGRSLSEHAFGNAIDINPLKNPMGSSLRTDMPPNISDLAAKYGLSWGGDWKSAKDAMHFEWTGRRVFEPNNSRNTNAVYLKSPKLNLDGKKKVVQKEAQTANDDSKKSTNASKKRKEKTPKDSKHFELTERYVSESNNSRNTNAVFSNLLNFNPDEKKKVVQKEAQTVNDDSKKLTNASKKREEEPRQDTYNTYQGKVGSESKKTLVNIYSRSDGVGNNYNNKRQAQYDNNIDPKLESSQKKSDQALNRDRAVEVATQYQQLRREMARDELKLKSQIAEYNKKAANPDYQGQSQKIQNILLMYDQLLQKAEQLDGGKETPEYKRIAAEKAEVVRKQSELEVAERKAATAQETQILRDGLLTQSQLRQTQQQRDLAAVDEWAERMRANGVSEIEIFEDAERQKANIRQKYAEQANPLAKQMREWSDVSDQIQKAEVGWMDSLAGGITGIITGTGNLRSVIDGILNDITNIAVKGMLSTMFGGQKGKGGKGLAFNAKSMFTKSGAVYHNGGLVGNRGLTRSVSALAFLGAPKFHTGGIVGGGLLPSEVPIIAQKGEGVFTPDQMRAMGGFQQNQSVQVNAPITVNGSAGTPEQNEDLAKRMSKQLDGTMRAIIADEMRKQSRPGSFLNNRSR